jgi:hypothetical protein
MCKCLPRAGVQVNGLQPRRRVLSSKELNRLLLRGNPPTLLHSCCTRRKLRLVCLDAHALSHKPLNHKNNGIRPIHHHKHMTRWNSFLNSFRGWSSRFSWHKRESHNENYSTLAHICIVDLSRHTRHSSCCYNRLHHDMCHLALVLGEQADSEREWAWQERAWQDWAWRE